VDRFRDSETETAAECPEHWANRWVCLGRPASYQRLVERHSEWLAIHCDSGGLGHVLSRYIATIQSIDGLGVRPDEQSAPGYAHARESHGKQHHLGAFVVARDDDGVMVRPDHSRALDGGCDERQRRSNPPAYSLGTAFLTRGRFRFARTDRLDELGAIWHVYRAY
jgi:hypothetical protein